jgi:hypothetical protein
MPKKKAKRRRFDLMVLEHVRVQGVPFPNEWVKAKFLRISFLPFSGDIVYVKKQDGEEVGFRNWGKNVRGLTSKTIRLFGKWNPKTQKAPRPKP